MRNKIKIKAKRKCAESYLNHSYAQGGQHSHMGKIRNTTRNKQNKSVSSKLERLCNNRSTTIECKRGSMETILMDKKKRALSVGKIQNCDDYVLLHGAFVPDVGEKNY
jgi:hypothetical protein